MFEVWDGELQTDSNAEGIGLMIVHLAGRGGIVVKCGLVLAQLIGNGAWRASIRKKRGDF